MRKVITAMFVAFAGLIASAIGAEATTLEYLLIGNGDTGHPSGGDPFIFHLFVDTNQSGTPRPTGGTYYQAHATEQYGAYKWSTPNGITSKWGELRVLHGPVTDYVQIDLRTIPDPANPLPPMTGVFTIVFKTGFGAISDESLPPLETFLLGKFPWSSGFYLDNVPLGRITQITLATPVSQAPIPAALPLFASALGGLGFLGWRRKRPMRNTGIIRQ